ncbi:hypothetical protein LCGC14_0583720 [marine sediment metagenome]|uniref:Uncharacterized protein n=1 Tax=marine sediment metagenome TaxID=412755 RepID=A0A0F9U1U5_9ZZZZ
MAKRSWNEYRELVLHELERFQKWLEDLTAKAGTQKEGTDSKIEVLRGEIQELKREITGIKVRVSVYAALGGGLISAIMWGLKIYLG